MQLLVLPLAQIFARTAYLSVMAAGAVTTFSRGFRSIAQDFAEVRPTVFVGVPRVFETLARGWQESFAQGPIGQRLIEGIRALARERASADGRWTGLRQLRYSVANVAAYRGVRQVFGAASASRSQAARPCAWSSASSCSEPVCLCLRAMV